jgi:hypothetical protein
MCSEKKSYKFYHKIIFISHYIFSLYENSSFSIVEENLDLTFPLPSQSLSLSFARVLYVTPNDYFLINYMPRAGVEYVCNKSITRKKIIIEKLFN